MTRESPVVGVRYRMQIQGEPVPKSTQRPPNTKSSYYRMHLIQTEPNYKPIRQTLEYQEYVATLFMASKEMPVFDPDDPIAIGLLFMKGKHALGDLKNLEAAVEDAAQRSGCIPNDRQIVGRLFSSIDYYCKEPGTYVALEIDQRVLEYDWLYNWLQRKHRRVSEYAEKRGLKIEPAVGSNKAQGFNLQISLPPESDDGVRQQNIAKADIDGWLGRRQAK